MNQQNTVTDKITCEAYGCVAAAEEEIHVPVGQTREISLYVCSNCRPKFFVPKENCNTLSDQSIADLRSNPGDRSPLNDEY